MAKFDDCAALPDPGDLQAVVKGTNRFGCFYSQKSQQTGNPHLSRTICRRNKWAPGFPGFLRRNATPICQASTLTLAIVARKWNTTLSAPQRQAWRDLAATVTITNYKNTLVAPNGFELFMHFNLWRKAAREHRINVARLANISIQANPPASWPSLPAPVINFFSAPDPTTHDFEVFNFPTPTTVPEVGGLYNYGALGAPARVWSYFTIIFIGALYDPATNRMFVRFTSDRPFGFPAGAPAATILVTRFVDPTTLVVGPPGFTFWAV